MTTPIGPPIAAPTTLRGALSTFPTFVRRNVPAIVASAVAAGILGWVVNVWMLAVKFEGNNDVPSGSPVSGQNNTGWATIFWVLFSMVLFGAVGYARAVGMRRFWADLRTTPRTLFALARRDGVAGRVHLLWGAALALLLGLLIPPAVGAVLSVGILATLTTIIGAITGSVLGRMFSGLLKPFRAGAQPIGIDAMIVGLVGSGLALAVAFVVPNRSIRAAAAGVCILLAIVLAQQLKPTASVAVIVVVAGAYQAMRWVLHAKQVLADDGGFAECGLDFGTWWRQCDGAGAVRRQAVPGGVAAALGSPVGLFLGSWAGSMARLVPHIIHPHPTTPSQPGTKGVENPVDVWRARPPAGTPDVPVSIDLPDGNALTCAVDLHGRHSMPWLTVGHDGPPTPIDPISEPHSFPWRPDPPPDPFVASTPTHDPTGIAQRLNDLHRHAPGPQFMPEVQRLYESAPHQPLDDSLAHLARLENEHSNVWTQRLADANQRLDVDMAQHLSASPDAAQQASAANSAKPMSNVVALMRDQADRFAGVSHVGSADAATARHLFHNGTVTVPDAIPVVQQLETTLTEMQHMAEHAQSLPGYPTATALGQHQTVPHGGPVGIAGTGLTAHADIPHTGHHGMGIGLQRSDLPLPAGSQLVDTPDGHALVTSSAPGSIRELAVDTNHARTVVNAPDHVDRLAATRRFEQASELTRQFDATAATVHQLEVLQQQSQALTDTYTELTRLGTQIAADPAAMRDLATTMPWRADDVVEAVNRGTSSMPLSRTALPSDAELAWFRNQHRDLALVGADHTGLARGLAPAGAPELVEQLELLQNTMHQMHDQHVFAATLDQLNDMQHMLGDVVGGRLDPLTANQLSQQHYGVQLAELTDQAQRAMAAMLAQRAAST